MLSQSSWSFLFWLCAVTALSVRGNSEEKPLSCTGGTIYFSAHPVDGLLYQNPDLLRDLYVLKCVTTVVFTSGDRGIEGNFSQSLERGLQEAYVLMAGIPVSNPTREEATIRVGTHDVHSWSLRGMPNIQILYLRLPDGSPSGEGYHLSGRRSLSQLYRKEIGSITSTDGNATYTLRDLKELVGFILHTRKPKDVRVLNHKATLSNGPQPIAPADHTDHIVSAKLVHSVFVSERINGTIQAYGGNVVRKFEANLNASRRAFAKKATAFFKYAAYDEQMCHSLDECSNRLDDGGDEVHAEDDVRYVADYLGREYYVT
ncbi:hypothetical protein EK21DRAFT_114996 [Setomelanomma holmii]|uniref:Uncharacterized protein n=1 Tax=Setomelanomma holmii TaxID=210430 RepID=A0A9P4LJ51_9PLEO|nr:hypothetical protein EK21DRAFT_114996 [Setomelanomma holmii]